MVQKKLIEIPHKPRNIKVLESKILPDNYSLIKKNAPRQANAYYVIDDPLFLTTGTFYSISYYKFRTI